MFVSEYNAPEDFELVWQGEGVGYLSHDRSQKEAVINEFVAKILMQYPPVLEKK